MIRLGEPHSISTIEWVTGFTTVLAFWIGLVLLWYLWKHRDERWQAHYRIATWFVLGCIGATLRNGFVWIEIFRRPELVDFIEVNKAYPLIGAVPWVVGTMFTAVCIVLLCREFGDAYLGRYTWIPALVLASLVPLISIWYY